MGINFKQAIRNAFETHVPQSYTALAASVAFVQTGMSASDPLTSQFLMMSCMASAGAALYHMHKSDQHFQQIAQENNEAKNRVIIDAEAARLVKMIDGYANLVAYKVAQNVAQQTPSQEPG